MVNIKCNRVTGAFNGFRDIARRYSVSPSTVTKVWKPYCEQYPEMALPVLGGNNVRLNHNDLVLIEVLTAAKGSISLRYMHDSLLDFGNVGTYISVLAISR